MNESAKALLRQNKIFLGVVVCIILCILCFAYMNVDSSVPVVSSNEIKIDLPGDKISPQDIWMDRIESGNKLMEQKLKYLENVVLESKKQEIESSREKSNLQNEISQLRKELRNTIDNRSQNIEKNQVEQDPLVYSEAQINQFEISEEIVVMRQPLREIIMPDSRENLHHVDEMIPAGTTVQAILVSSLDAVCGVFSTSDPTPIKLRILDNAHLPKHVNVKLKGGIIIGSAYGNISSERVYMRLERLTQVQNSGDFVETVVTGYVSGEDGKYGVRGIVVDKSSKAVMNATAAGFLAGVSDALQAAYGRRNDSLSNYNIASDVVTQGSSSGSSRGLDMLADYYIKRAEQIQPVIQVNAGRVVDVTFTLGVPTGDFHARETLKKIRQNNK